VQVEKILQKIASRQDDRLDMLFIHVDSFYSLYYSLFNAGLLSIATVCRDAGFRVRCMSTSDLFGLTPAALKSFVQRTRPALVGFYTLSDNIQAVERYATWMKAWHPECRVVLGGPLANIDPEGLLSAPCFDLAVRGEGEFVMRDLGEYFVRGQGSLESIDALTYKVGEVVRTNPRGQTIRDLDQLPFPDQDLLGVRHGFHISTGRGCPYKCAFCFQKVHEGPFRFRSAPNVVAEITSRLEKYDVKSFYITDDVFAVNYDRVREISRRLKEYRANTGRDFVFFCEGRAEVLHRHPDMIDMLVEAGMARLQIGIETGNQRMLDEYRKKLRLEHVVSTVQHAARVGGLTVAGNFILGGPHETEETFQQTLDFAKALLQEAPGVFECVNSFLTPLPATAIAEDPGSFGLRILDTEFLTGMTLNDAWCETEALDRNRLRALDRVFQAGVHQTMARLLPELPFSTVENHFRWARKYRLNTYYYLEHLSRCEILDHYFLFHSSPRFRRLEEIPREEFPDWIPTRTIERREYSADGRRLYLRGDFGRRAFLGRPHEVRIFEYSASKLTAGQIARRLQAEMGQDKTVEEILDRWMIPLYRRLEKRFQVIFQQ